MSSMKAHRQVTDVVDEVTLDALERNNAADRRHLLAVRGLAQSYLCAVEDRLLAARFESDPDVAVLDGAVSSIEDFHDLNRIKPLPKLANALQAGEDICALSGGQLRHSYLPFFSCSA